MALRLGGQPRTEKPLGRLAAHGMVALEAATAATIGWKQ